jgi:hypothetical protein
MSDEDERIWTDKETGKIHELNKGDNYMIKYMGFCSYCGGVLTQAAKLIMPNEKEWLEVNCEKCNPKDL